MEKPSRSELAVGIIVVLYLGIIFWAIHFFEIKDNITGLNDLLVLGVVLFLPLILSILSELLPLIRRFEFKDLRIEFEEKVEEVEEKIEEEKKRLEQISNSHKNTLHSLAGLVITNPWKNKEYINYITKREKKTLIIGCQEYTEQLLLCAIIARLLKERSPYDFKVLPKFDFGGVNLNFISLSRGDIDMYPAYTWQGFEIAFATSLLQNSDEIRGLKPEKAIEQLNKIYEPFDQTDQMDHPFWWVGYLGYYNNFEMIMGAELAREHGLERISQLCRYPGEFVFGCDPDFFGRPNGYELLKSDSVYGIRFKEVRHFDHEDKYQALESGAVDIIDGFTTDPHLERKNEFISLQDDFTAPQQKKPGVFGIYYSSVIVRSQLIQKFPEIKNILESLVGQIEVDDIRDMIRRADQQRENQTAKIKEIAEEFLEEKALI